MWSRSVVVNQIVRDEDDGILGLKGRVLNVSLIDKRGEYESASTTFVAPFLTLSMSVDNTVGDLKTELEKHDASTYRDATRMGRTTRTSLCRFGVPHTTQREGTYYLLDEGLPIVQLPDRQLSTGFFPVFVLNNDCDGILGSIGPLVPEVMDPRRKKLVKRKWDKSWSKDKVERFEQDGTPTVFEIVRKPPAKAKER